MYCVRTLPREQSDTVLAGVDVFEGNSSVAATSDDEAEEVAPPFLSDTSDHGGMSIATKSLAEAERASDRDMAHGSLRCVLALLHARDHPEPR